MSSIVAHATPRRLNYGPMDSFPAVVADRARRTPDKILLREVTGRESSCAGFQQDVLTWSAALQRLGVEAGECVISMQPNPTDSLASWLGLAWLRAVETPINLQFVGRMLAYVINDARARFIVASERILPAITAIAGELGNIRAVVVPDLQGAAPELPFAVLSGTEFFRDIKPAEGLKAPERHDVATMIYTSGTTGPSKGVMYPWGLLTDMCDAISYHLGEDDVAYNPLPMFHTGGKATAQTVITAGGSVVLRERFRTEDFWDDIRQWGCTFAPLYPAMSEWLLGRPPHPDDAANPLRRVSMSPVIPRAEEFKKRFRVEIQTCYGLTEGGLPVATAPYMSDMTENYESCGRIMPAYEARIVDAHDYEVPDGEVGELVLRSKLPWGVMCGYFGRPEATLAAWRNGWFHTGDAFRRDADGNLYFVDRMKDALRRRGENVSSFEVEALVNEHPDVQHSAVIGVPSEYGEDEIKVCVILKPDAGSDAAALLEEVATHMPRFMVPRYIEFVDELPRTEATLRVQKAKLRENWRTSRTWDRQTGQFLQE